MLPEIHKMVEAFDNGRLSRRELVVRLGGLVTAAAAGPNIASAALESSPTFKAAGLNHIALRVTDVRRSRDFYKKHLGLKVLRESGEQNCFLSCGDHFVALFRGREPRMDHRCYTVEGYAAEKSVKTLRAAGLEPRREGNRVYFPDPDDLTIQVAGPRSSWPGE